MKIRLYRDEDSMDRALIRALRARGVDVISALDDGMIERSDEDHLDYSSRTGRVLFSFNVADYFRLHTIRLEAGAGHAGIILARQQRYPLGETMRRILKLIATIRAEEMIDRVEFLSRWEG